LKNDSKIDPAKSENDVQTKEKIPEKILTEIRKTEDRISNKSKLLDIIKSKKEEKSKIAAEHNNANMSDNIFVVPLGET